MLPLPWSVNEGQNFAVLKTNCWPVRAAAVII